MPKMARANQARCDNLVAARQAKAGVMPLVLSREIFFASYVGRLTDAHARTLSVARGTGEPARAARGGQPRHLRPLPGGRCHADGRRDDGVRRKALQRPSERPARGAPPDVRAATRTALEAVKGGSCAPAGSSGAWWRGTRETPPGVRGGRLGAGCARRRATQPFRALLSGHAAARAALRGHRRRRRARRLPRGAGAADDAPRLPVHGGGGRRPARPARGSARNAKHLQTHTDTRVLQSSPGIERQFFVSSSVAPSRHATSPCVPNAPLPKSPGHLPFSTTSPGPSTANRTWDVGVDCMAGTEPSRLPH
jgi:hypothetical protein